MDHLKEAKRYVVTGPDFSTQEAMLSANFAIGHALIAIAERLDEIINRPHMGQPAIRTVAALRR